MLLAKTSFILSSESIRRYISLQRGKTPIDSTRREILPFSVISSSKLKNLQSEYLNLGRRKTFKINTGVFFLQSIKPEGAKHHLHHCSNWTTDRVKSKKTKARKKIIVSYKKTWILFVRQVTIQITLQKQGSGSCFGGGIISPEIFAPEQEIFFQVLE